MDTTFVKLLLAAAILFVLWKMMAKRGGGRWSRVAAAPRGYYPDEFYQDADDEDFADDANDEDDADDEDEDEAEDEDEDYAQDDDSDEDNAEDIEDSDYAEGYETFAPLSASVDLLPKPSAKSQTFAEFAPKGLQGQNFLDTSKFIGVNTKGSSLRNANYDLRSAPSIQRRQVGPWSQSTIDADLMRKPLE
jgi:hypothetical protein